MNIIYPGQDLSLTFSVESINPDFSLDMFNSFDITVYTVESYISA
jgi:hypothetical protein